MDRFDRLVAAERAGTEAAKDVIRLIEDYASDYDGEERDEFMWSIMGSVSAAFRRYVG